VNAGNYGAACGEMKKYVNAGGRVLQGLVTRRNAECNLFNSCQGLNVLGAYRQCAAADPCHQCLLNSENDATFTLYEELGYNTSCSYDNWAYLANDWCTNTNPWECYWKTASGTPANMTVDCPMCPNLPVPTVPKPPNPEDINCTVTLPNACMIDECPAILENSTCDPLTGNCISPQELVAKLAKCNVTGYIPNDLPPNVASSQTVSYVLLALALFAVAFRYLETVE